MVTKKQPRGAPRGSINAASNGTRIDRRRLVVGEMPRKLLAAKRRACAYRRQLESEVEELRDITLLDAHAIDSASAATLHGAICQWLLRNKFGDMRVSDILACSAAIVKAKLDRDKAVQSLGLDEYPDMIDALYSKEPNQ